MQDKIVGVIGTSTPTEEEYKLAEEVGALIAEKGAGVICGGLGGVMEAVCKGAKSKNGLTIGILPGNLKGEANQYVDITIPTGMGQARNVILVQASDAIIAVGGGYGTLSEIAVALRLDVPLVGINTWKPQTPKSEKAPIIEFTTAKEAVEKAFEIISKPFHHKEVH